MAASDTTSPAISIVVPVKDEEENLEPLINEICASLNAHFASGDSVYEIVYVDDGSTDATPELLRQLMDRVPNLRALRHRECCGQSAAIATGVEAARAPLVGMLDGDGQNDPADMPALLVHYAEESAGGPESRGDSGGAVMIVGHRAKRRDTWLKRVSSKVANAVRGSLLKDDTPDTGCGLKVFSRDAFLGLPRFNHMHRFLPALMLRAGGRVISVPVNHRPRERGASKYGLWNRVWVGIVDMFGVMWLARRVAKPDVEPLEPSPSEPKT
ncbi:MAG: glycosyltransferase family 2 protein [Rhodospirillaceae bacterium]|nr:glycosyltransferase family 2 protein [Rhodospirillaceae bacterium]MBT5513009.1 glycosyltransferase family 2 protein [Rhodospirillaceae bacterium]